MCREPADYSGATRDATYVPCMKPDNDDTRISDRAIGLAGLLVGLISLMASLHLGPYVIVAFVSAGAGAGVTAALLLRRRR